MESLFTVYCIRPAKGETAEWVMVLDRKHMSFLIPVKGEMKTYKTRGGAERALKAMGQFIPAGYMSGVLAVRGDESRDELETMLVGRPVGPVRRKNG